MGLNGDEFYEDMKRQAIEDAEEEFAQGVAAEAREGGLATTDDLEIVIETDNSDWVIDVARVRARANAILSDE